MRYGYPYLLVNFETDSRTTLLTEAADALNERSS